MGKASSGKWQKEPSGLVEMGTIPSRSRPVPICAQTLLGWKGRFREKGLTGFQVLGVEVILLILPPHCLGFPNYLLSFVLP